MKPVFSRAKGSHFTVQLSSGWRLHRNTDCRVALRVEATDGYHANANFNHKLTAQTAGAATFRGAGEGGRVFSKTGGHVALQGENAAVVSAVFSAAAAGPVAVAGTLRTCVCTESICSPEDVPVSIVVPVL